MTTIGGGWLTEGTAARSPVQLMPVIHLLVVEHERMWCSGSPGRPDSPYGNRLCASCRALATEAVWRGELGEEEARRWLPRDFAEQRAKARVAMLEAVAAGRVRYADLAPRQTARSGRSTPGWFLDGVPAGDREAGTLDGLIDAGSIDADEGATARLVAAARA